MDLTQPQLAELTYAISTFSGPLTRRITDYLHGYQLGPRGYNLQGQALELTPDGYLPTEDGQSTGYWTGPMVPRDHSRFTEMQRALVRSFNFENVILEGIEFLADGVGVDEADWSLMAADQQPDILASAETQALIDEAEALLTAWWDRRDLPTALQKLLKTAIAHGRAPLRPRIPARYYDSQNRLKKEADPLKSLDALHLVLPEVGLSGVFVDPETLDRVGVTQVFYQNLTAWKSEWEVTHVNPDGKTLLMTLTPGAGLITSDPLDIGGRLWLFELKFQRGAVERDVLSNQDAVNVGKTMLNRNTHFAGFAQLYGIGIDPPTVGVTTITNPDGTTTVVDGGKQVNPGPGTQAFFQASVATKVTRTTGPTNQPVEIIEEQPYAGATYNKLEPAAPAAITAAIQEARQSIYAALRQRFVLMDDKATASGRSREVATGSFLRATSRYATATEHLIRELLEFALEVSALIQGQPGKYRNLRASVELRQHVFDPSPLQVASDLSLQQAGIISRQTLQGRIGIADTDAEDARILEEAQPPEPTPTPAPAADNEGVTTN
jgi:hypothetical protein